MNVWFCDAVAHLYIIANFGWRFCNSCISDMQCVHGFLQKLLCEPSPTSFRTFAEVFFGIQHILQVFQCHISNICNFPCKLLLSKSGIIASVFPCWALQSKDLPATVMGCSCGATHKTLVMSFALANAEERALIFEFMLLFCWLDWAARPLCCCWNLWQWTYLASALSQEGGLLRHLSAS